MYTDDFLSIIKNEIPINKLTIPPSGSAVKLHSTATVTGPNKICNTTRCPSGRNEGTCGIDITILFNA